MPAPLLPFFCHSALVMVLILFKEVKCKYILIIGSATNYLILENAWRNILYVSVMTTMSPSSLDKPLHTVRPSATYTESKM